MNVPIRFINLGPASAAGMTYSAVLNPGLSGVICTGAICNYTSGTGAVSITGLPEVLSSGQI